MSTIIRDGRIINAVLRKMSIENDFDIDNVYFNEWYKYIDIRDINDTKVFNCVTEYKNNTYKIMFFDGCFNPYLVKL